MEETTAVGAMQPHGDARHPGLQALFEYPLLDAITDRRTRRVAQGATIHAEGLTYESPNEPKPVSALEEAIMVVSTAGITGTSMHDGPLTKKDGKELGTPFLNVLSRSASSPDNAQAASFFLINDEGNWLIKQPRGQAALDLMSNFPRRWKDWKESDWLACAKALKHKLSDKRLEFPRHYPYYLGWNSQHSNLPGTSIFFPVVDCTRQYINAVLIILEPEGRRPFFIDDWQKFHPKNMADWVAWAAMKLGFIPNIPYHPIGGVKMIKSGFVDKDQVAPLGWAHTMRTDYGCFFQFQNLMLLAQAMGLGGWIHGSVFHPYIFQTDPEKGWHGLGFRMEEPKKKWGRRRWPPVPTTQPNPVGIDGVLEGLCPPYIGSMDEAVDKVIEEKYSATGASYGNVDLFARAYKKREYAEEYLKHATRFPPKTIQYAKDVCNYIYDTYGRFPAHVEAFYTPGIWLQMANLDIDYYDTFYAPDLYERQARHDEIWGLK